MLIVANPIYDVVFKALMEDIEIARGILSALIGMNIIELRLLPQEHVHKNQESGELIALRMDFCALIENDKGECYQVIIELQKAKVGTTALRFRHYLASRYLALEEVQAEGETQLIALPVISIYLLGYCLDEALPMAIKVQRDYCDAVTGRKIKKPAKHEFIEQLTHDAFFIQIPKIKGQMGTEMERVLSVFDQNRIVKGDAHRLEIDEKVVNTTPLLAKVFRKLNRLQESPEMNKIMTLEDIYLFEQQEMQREMRKEVEHERRLRIAAEERAEQRIQDAEKQKKDAEKQKADAEKEIERLRKLLDKKDGC
jgi:hypothetical protein